MNETQIKQIISVIVSIVGGILTAKGLVTTDQVGQISSELLSIVGPILSLAGIVYAAFSHTAVNQVASTSKLSIVRHITTTAEAALKVSRPNVVSENKIDLGATPTTVNPVDYSKKV